MAFTWSLVKTIKDIKINDMKSNFIVYVQIEVKRQHRVRETFHHLCRIQGVITSYTMNQAIQ